MHGLIVGQTESGKSCLGKTLARSFRAQKKLVGVCEPIHDPGWDADFRTADIDEFCEWMQHSREAFCFVDECGAYFNEGSSTEYYWLATRSRHWGHSVFFLSNRAMQVPRTMRDQTQRLYLFTSAAEDGKLLAAEWNKPELVACNALPQFEFFYVSKYDTSKRLRIADYNRVESVEHGSNDNRNRQSGNARRAGVTRVERTGKDKEHEQ